MAWRTTGLALTLLLPTVGLSAEPYESSASLDAGSVLADMPLSGRDWRVEQAVRSDGRMNHYRIHGPDGPVEVVGDVLARERAREFEAVAVIREIKTTEAYADALERAGRSTLGAARDVIVDPVHAVHELPSGVRIIAGEVIAAAGAVGKGEEGVDVSETVKGAIGYHTAKRRLARELGVDPYSSNATLQRELDDLAWAVYAGGATIDAAMLAAPMAVSLSVRGAKTATLARRGDRDVSPARLYAEAEDVLDGLGLTDDQTEAALYGGACSPRHRGETVAALAAHGSGAWRAAVAHELSRLREEEECRALVAALRMLSAVSPKPAQLAWGDRSLVGEAADRPLLLMHADRLAWTPSLAATLEAAKRGGSLRLSGVVTPVARQALEARGWVTRAKQEAAEQPVPVFDILLPERVAEAEEEGEDQENESLGLLKRAGRGVKDAGNKVGDLVKEPFD
jgi:hypothetical protein